MDTEQPPDLIEHYRRYKIFRCAIFIIGSANAVAFMWDVILDTYKAGGHIGWPGILTFGIQWFVLTTFWRRDELIWGWFRKQCYGCKKCVNDAGDESICR